LNVVSDALLRVIEAELAFIGLLIDLQSTQFISDEFVKRAKRVEANQERWTDL